MVFSPFYCCILFLPFAVLLFCHKQRKCPVDIFAEAALYKIYLTAEDMGYRFGQATRPQSITTWRRRTGGTNPKEACTSFFVFYAVKKQKDHLLQDGLFAFTWRRLTFPGGRANKSILWGCGAGRVTVYGKIKVQRMAEIKYSNKMAKKPLSAPR